MIAMVSRNLQMLGDPLEMTRQHAEMEGEMWWVSASGEVVRVRSAVV